jgi:hypothetical protein
VGRIQYGDDHDYNCGYRRCDDIVATIERDHDQSSGRQQGGHPNCGGQKEP